jgi:glycosyltransferase involved in cell wall biosynthesis
MPEFDRQSGERRIWHLLEFLREAGWSVTFVTEHGSTDDRYARMLQRAGIETYPAATRDVVEDLIEFGRFDLALLAFWRVAEEILPLVRKLSPTTAVVVDSVDLHFVRNARRLLQRTAGETPGLGPTFGDEIVRELNVYAAADAVLTVSEKEAQLLNDLVIERTLATAVPDAEDFERATTPRVERKGILYLGNFQHPPNVEGLDYLCDDILPRVDSALLSSHRVQVVGNALDQERIRRRGSSLDFVQLVGWVPAVQPYLGRARILVAPLLHGAGTKRKLIQALMVGTPTVATPVAVEGLDVRDGEHVLVARSSFEFARAIERLLTDAELWERLAARGIDHVQRTHSREAVRRRFLNLCENVIQQHFETLTARGQDSAQSAARNHESVPRVLSKAVARASIQARAWFPIHY